MEIDTLVLSGCGPSGLAYTGVFRALLEKGILTTELDGIREIITTSVGILFAFAILIKLDNNAIREIVMRFDIGSMLNVDDIQIDTLLQDCGLYETIGIRKIFTSLCKNILHRDDITLQELYDLIPICLAIKVFNVTETRTEYISYKTHPTLSIITLAEMTTAIPIFFKPVSYNGCLYTDGGLRGSFPIEYCKSPNYLGIYIDGACTEYIPDMTELCPILKYMMSLLAESNPHLHQETTPRVIYLKVGLGLDFQIEDSLKLKVIQEVYQKTLVHINEHLDKD